MLFECSYFIHPSRQTDGCKAMHLIPQVCSKRIRSIEFATVSPDMKIPCLTSENEPQNLYVFQNDSEKLNLQKIGLPPNTSTLGFP